MVGDSRKNVRLTEPKSAHCIKKFTPPGCPTPSPTLSTLNTTSLRSNITTYGAPVSANRGDPSKSSTAPANGAQVQRLKYRTDGSIAHNSIFANPTYSYAGSPVAHAPANVNGSPLTYDANGNMTRGLNGKTMTYDGENRPLSVTYQGKTTTYVYGADGKRIKKIEQAGTAQQRQTLYLGPLEVQGNDWIVYPHPNLRVINGTPSYIHQDMRGSTRLTTSQTGAKQEGTTYMPFGLPSFKQHSLPTTPVEEGKQFLGERYDRDAMLSYLNARYYDPELGMIVQPDWFEVTEPGVGTNRYSYSFNDPVNLVDPEGNITRGHDWGEDQEEADGKNYEQAEKYESMAKEIEEDDSLWGAFRRSVGLHKSYRKSAAHHLDRVGITGIRELPPIFRR